MNPIDSPIDSPIDPEDRLLRRLAGMWDDVDAVPADVVTRAVFAVQLERLDAALLELQDDVLELAGVRSSEAVRTLRFTSAETAIMLTITTGGPGPVGGRAATAGLRIDGWVSPGRRGVVELHRERGRPARQPVDRNGRFAFPRVDPTLGQLVFRPTTPSGPGAAVACPPIRF